MLFIRYFDESFTSGLANVRVHVTARLPHHHNSFLDTIVPYKHSPVLSYQTVVQISFCLQFIYLFAEIKESLKKTDSEDLNFFTTCNFVNDIVQAIEGHLTLIA